VCGLGGRLVGEWLVWLGRLRLDGVLAVLEWIGLVMVVVVDDEGGLWCIGVRNWGGQDAS
jgi:hypothetical protein